MKREESGISFGECVLNRASRTLLRRGEPVALEPRAFEFLVYLASHRDRAVSKQEILEAVWPGVVVSDAALSRCLMMARRAVGDNAEKQAVLRTVHGYGYQFVAAVEEFAEQRNRGKNAVGPGRISRQLTAGIVSVLLLGASLAGWWESRAVPVATRVAILPLIDETDDPELQWLEIGGTTILAETLTRTFDIETVSGRPMLNLFESATNGEEFRESIVPPADFLDDLDTAFQVSHVLTGKMSKEGNAYRLQYRIADQDTVHEGWLESASAIILLEKLAQRVSLDVRHVPWSVRQLVRPDANLSQLIARGHYSMANGEVESARQLFKLAIDTAPGEYWPRNDYARTLLAAGRLVEAEQAFLELVKLADSRFKAREQWSSRSTLADVYYAMDRTNPAIRYKMEALQIAERSGLRERAAINAYDLGLIYSYKWEAGNARFWFERAMAEYKEMNLPIEGKLLAAVADIEMREGRFDESETHFREAIQYYSLFADVGALARVYFFWGQLEFERADYEAARQKYERAIEMFSKTEFRFRQAIVLAYLAETMFVLGDFNAARRIAEESVEKGEKTHNGVAVDYAWAVIADMAAAEKNVKVMQQYEQREFSDSFARRSLNVLGRIALAEGRFDKAEELADQVVAMEVPEPYLKTEYAAALQQKAISRSSRGETKTALELAGDAYDLVSKSPFTRATLRVGETLVDLQLRAGNIAAADAVTRHLFRLRPRSIGALRSMAKTRFAQADFRSAREALLELRSIAGDWWTSQDDALLGELNAS